MFCCWQFLTSCWGPSLLWGWEEWWCPAYSVSRVAPAYGPSSAPWPAARNVASNAAVAGRVAKNAKVCFHHWKPFSSLKTLFRSKFLIKLSESMVMSDRSWNVDVNACGPNIILGKQPRTSFKTNIKVFILTYYLLLYFWNKPIWHVHEDY